MRSAVTKIYPLFYHLSHEFLSVNMQNRILNHKFHKYLVNFVYDSTNLQQHFIQNNNINNTILDKISENVHIQQF